MSVVIDILAVIGALWIALTVFFAASDTIKDNQEVRIDADAPTPRGANNNGR